MWDHKFPTSEECDVYYNFDDNDVDDDDDDDDDNDVVADWEGWGGD